MVYIEDALVHTLLGRLVKDEEEEEEVVLMREECRDDKVEGKGREEKNR